MDLWIRSQNKKILEKVDTIMYDNTNLEHDGMLPEYNVIVGHFIKSGTMTLGEYKSEERALEIIEEIIKEIHKLQNNSAYGVRGWFYQMPLE